MSTIPRRPAVIDTNIIFEGLTKQGGASGLIIDAWLAGLFRACVSNSLAYEYMEVLSRELSEARWQKIQPILGMLLAQAEFVTIYYSWRPISPMRINLRFNLTRTREREGEAPGEPKKLGGSLALPWLLPQMSEISSKRRRH